MRSRLPFLRWVALLAAAAGALGASAVHAQPRLRIRAESRVELRVERGSAALTVRGYLRDDLGNPLPDRRIELRMDPTGAGAAVRRTARTDERGAFSGEFPLAQGSHRLTARFDGDASHDRATVTRPLDLTRDDVRLQLQVPNDGRLDLARREHEIVVWAASAASGDGLRVELRDELDRRLASGTTDSAGRVRFSVASEALGAPGPGRIKALTPGDAERSAAQTELAVVRERPTQLTLRARTEGKDLMLEGSLEDDRGGLPGRAVGLFAENEEHVATVLTEESGRFRHRLDAARRTEQPFVLQARFESDAAGRTSAQSDPVTVPARPGGPPQWPWLLLPIAVTLLLWPLLGRRKPQAKPAEPRRPPPARAGVQAGAMMSSAAARHDLGARIVDSRDGLPIAGAMATLAPDGGRPRSATVERGGRLEARDLPAGTWSLRVEADGYAPVEARIEVPHRGQWSHAVVRMDSYRALVLRPFRNLAERWLPALRRWETWTNREVAERARARGAGPGFTRLAEDVEQVYYGPYEPTRADVEAVERAAATARAEATPTGGEDEGSDDVDWRSRGSL
ncbi:MAG: carboxypeptidase regulatory-like domain-containing protein [Myxococcota bacterium]